MKKGLTLIELLLVISLITIVGTLTTPFAGAFLLRVQQESVVNAIVTAFHLVQMNSLDGKGSGAWGICQTGQIIRVYLGSCASPTQAIDNSIGSSINVSGLSNTIYTRGTGSPASSLNITVSSSIASNNITVNSLGVINVQ
ncbi:MAG: type II secretion system protein [bacterium]